MSQKEIYRLDINIGVKGDKEAKRKLTATERFAKQTEKRTKALDKIKASPTVRLKDKLSKPLQKVEGKLSNFSKKACSKLAAIATAGAVMVGGLGLGSTIKTFSDYEQGLANVKSISGATVEEMRVLGKEAKRLGAATAWSAKEVTDAEMLLSQAGFSVKETISALPGLLDLASAGELDLATATDITAGTLRAFGIEASKSAHVADVLALTASATNSDVSGLGESLKYVAPVSKSLGVSMEETSAAIGLLANANIKGSQAGTVLRASLARLANPADKAADMMKKLGFKAFDAKGKMLPLDKVIGNLKKSMNGLTKQQQAQAISTIFGTEAMSGMMALVEQGPDKLRQLTNELQKSDGAAKNMANTRLDSLQGQMTILKSAVEGMKIEIGEKLAPYAKEFVTWFTAKIPAITNGIMKIVDKVFALARGFNELSLTAKKSIAVLTGVTLTIGPLIKSIKTLVGMRSKIKGFFALLGGAKTVKAAAAVKGVETAATAAAGTAATGGMAGLAASFGPAIAAAAPWVAGAVAIAGAGYGIYKVLNKKVIPEVDLFADKVEETADGMSTNTIKISKATKKTLGAYMDLDDKVSKALMSLKFNSEKITEKNSKNIVETFEKMGTQINTAIDKKFKKQYDVAVRFFNSNSTLTENEERKILEKMNKHNEFEKQTVEQGVARIIEIKNRALADKRELSDEEFRIISTIQDNMKRTAVETMTQSEVEQRVIMERLKSEAENITAQQAASVIKNSAEARDRTIADANKKYDETVAWVIRERDEKGTISAEEASKIIEGAKKQKEESIEHAKEMHYDVVQHAREQCSEHIEQIDIETGEVMNVWGRAKQWFKDNPITRYFKTQDEKAKGFQREQQNRRTPDPVIYEPHTGRPTGPGYASGTNYATSGIHEVAERGIEIVFGRQHKLFNGGEKVLNHRESKDFLNSQSVEEPKPKFMVAKPTLVGAGGGNVNIDVDVENNFDNDTDVDEVVQQAVQEFGYKLKEALKNIKK